MPHDGAVNDAGEHQLPKICQVHSCGSVFALPQEHEGVGGSDRVLLAQLLIFVLTTLLALLRAQEVLLSPQRRREVFPDRYAPPLIHR